ncbi:MAG: amino acid adenylation domain-containing protein, partial [Acidobacteria bacterium]|nr:amino acid adenylation domain-containing protein [Acidobacteriota bacterium]
FFELGGHSLLAAQAASRIGEVFKIELALRRVFESPSVAQLSAFIQQELRADHVQEEERIERVSREKDLELSYGQQQLWLLEQLGVDAGTYNISAAVQLRGELHLSVLQESFNDIIRRHEVIRTTYTDVHGRPVQQIAPELPVELTVEDLTRLDQKEREREVKGIAKQEANRRFDLRRGPLLHVRLLRTKEHEHVLILTMHHIVSDGWSIGIIMKELSELYSAHLEKREASLEELEIQYPDYAAWQRERLGSDSLNQQMEYWRKHLAGELPVLELPTDHPRPAVQSYRGASEHVRIGKELRDHLRKLCRRENATLYMILMAAYKVLLHKYTGQQDVIVGTPIAGRTNRQVKNLIGFFVNMLVMRTEVKDDDSFLELLKKEREVALNAYANQEVPFEKLVEELRPNVDLSRSPIFQVAFNMLNFPKVKTELPGLTLDTFLPLEAEAKFDITLYAGEQPDGLQLDLIYNVDLFTRERMAQMLEQFVGLLTQIVEDSERLVSHLSLITPSAERLLPDPRQPIAPEWEGPVHQALSRQAHRVANRQAIKHARGAWTYQELDYFSNQLSHYLYSNGIRRGDIVAIYADRSPSLVWAILGILKAGAAFAILDSAYSASRLIRYIEAIKPRAWIQIKEAGLLPVALENHVAASPLQCRIELSWETAKSALKDCPGSDLNISVDADDLAYVAFTSGSTGRPKVILGTHRPLSHFLKWHTETFALHESDRFSILSGISHDPVLRDIFTPLWLGATLCIPAPEVMQLPGMLADWLRQESISIAHMTPAMVQLLGEASTRHPVGAHHPAQIPSLRYVFLGGDVATRRDVLTLRSLASGVRCVNFYGTTETPQAMGYFVIHERPEEEGEGNTNAKETIPIGRGIDGVQLLLLTPASLLAGIGEIGEICVRTPYLSKGYLDDETHTHERFIANPFRDEEADRIYRTADLGRSLPDGNIEFLGRMDRQLKIRGFRIELEEIEQPLSKHPDVRNCVVASRADKSGLKRLIAYLVTDGEAVPKARELRNFLKDQLPEHMIPAAFVQVEKLPLTANGKIDYRALPAPDDNAFALNTNYVPPRSELERNLAEIWKSLLEVERISIYDNFFELGGYSILATQCLSRVREVFQVEIPLMSLFQEPTFINLAERIYAAQLEGRQTSLPPIMRVSREVE